MKAGESFLTHDSVLAIGRNGAIIIPSNSTIRVVKFPCQHDDRMAAVMWDEKPLTMYSLDLRHRAKEIRAERTGWIES